MQNAINFHIFLYCEMRSEVAIIFCCQRFISCMRSFECCSFFTTLRTLYFSQGSLFYTSSQVHHHVVHIVCLLIRSYELQLFRSPSAPAFWLCICSIVLHKVHEDHSAACSNLTNKTLLYLCVFLQCILTSSFSDSYKNQLWSYIYRWFWRYGKKSYLAPTKWV